ncbi:MAG TPA: hypothetical protein VJ325_05180 [Thiobacillus sp.]|nr:hypothetical protein [Thiobacillus sp.]
MTINLNELGQALIELGAKNDPPLAPVGPYHHGAAGLLNIPGTDQKIVSALALPVTGALGTFPVMRAGTEFGGEMVDATNILTGLTSGAADDWSNQPTTDCADGPVGGLKKLCTVVNQFARIRGSTREVSMWRAGQRADYADMPMTVLNNPAISAGPFMSALLPSLQTALSYDIQERLFETLASLLRMFCRRVWIGTPANNVGEARDLWGLDSQINVSTHKDKLTDAVCSAADSDVKNFGYSLITGNAKDIVQYVEMCDTYVYWNAIQQGLMPYDYDVFMHPNAWPTISEIWPIRQFQAFIAQMATLNAAGAAAGGVGDINLTDALNLRSQFRNAMTLPINGRAHRVILDEGITEQSPDQNANLQPGQWASTIYGVPRTFLGGLPGTFWKYFNHDNAQARAIGQFISQQQGNGPTFTSDGGLFRWFSNFKNGCLKLTFEFAPSLHVVVPQLAWRIDNVAYQPLQHLRSAFPASSYFKDGGRTEGDTPSFYAGWTSAGVPTTLT